MRWGGAFFPANVVKMPPSEFREAAKPKNLDEKAAYESEGI